MKKTFGLLLGLSIILTLSGCKEKTVQQDNINSIDLTGNNIPSDIIATTPQKWHVTNKRICLLFGYDFNSPERSSNLLKFLEEKYGLDENGGLIYPLTYPTSFKHGVRSYVSELTSELQSNDKDFIGIIILGAPENTHTALARNQDGWNQEVPYPVIALFPQDDVLGLESTCDIVIDKGNSAGTISDMSEESEVTVIPEAPEVLSETIEYIQTLNYSLQKNSKIQTHVLQMYKNRKIKHYVDPESGLQSINHFVLY